MLTEEHGGLRDRKSTSAGIMFLNGLPFHSQKITGFDSTIVLRGGVTCSSRLYLQRVAVEATDTILVEAGGIKVRERRRGGDETLPGFNFSTSNDQSFRSWKEQAYIYTIAMVKTSVEETLGQGWIRALRT